jgi:hypothetical protein
MTLRAIGVPWFRPEDYARIREMSQDQLFDDFKQWEQQAERKFAELVAKGVPLEKVFVDPDALAVFARDSHGGKINGAVRAEFAARLIAEKYGADH